MGPSFIQIGTEGGFLPAPVVVENQPITWVTGPTVFNAGNVDKHALLIAPAERADVIVDFSPYAGQTLILYNDAPAAFPALDVRYDYYTGHPDYTDSGGTPTTQPGYGPNTRTVMQIKVANNVSAPAYNLATLKSVFAKTAAKRGVFEVSQDPILVPEARYNSAYNMNFPADTFVRIFQFNHTFRTLAGNTVSLPLVSKSIQDEMGEAYDQYGRMSGMLGLQVKTANNQQNLLHYGYSSPPLDFIRDSKIGSMIGSLGDGTQIWKITHNGVDTHPVHWHLYNIQTINRVGWDNIIRPAKDNELGWKETLRVSPLEDTIIALRAKTPVLPFELPNSVRLIEPNMAEGGVLPGGPGGLGFSDIAGNPVTVVNHVVNYGWEYVFHCHILAHEEMDMMHSQIFAVAPRPPAALTATNAGNASAFRVNLAWLDDSISETGFTLERSVAFTGPWTEIGSVPSATGPQKGSTVTFADTTGTPLTSYYYRVLSANTLGDTTTYAAAVGFPHMTVNSTPSNVAASAP